MASVTFNNEITRSKSNIDYASNKNIHEHKLHSRNTGNKQGLSSSKEDSLEVLLQTGIAELVVTVDICTGSLMGILQIEQYKSFRLCWTRNRQPYPGIVRASDPAARGSSPSEGGRQNEKKREKSSGIFREAEQNPFLESIGGLAQKDSGMSDFSME
ncbi:hypothetical protein TNCT_73321 [Trichonephila clavata]|uniref:Uncharacterized protein n=1 Tax=Trichonephila clavata TaxID=2740835 RepID=A0A8X6EWJ3_TRICU|nr:hypothetical protein TNCT_73321 [Trichonephila clavata]